MSVINCIDIHGYTRAEAKGRLDNFLKQVPKSIHEVVVIHGYRSGTQLRSYVRNSYKHPRMLRTMQSMNPGETILILK